MIRKFFRDTRDLLRDALALVGLSRSSLVWRQQRWRRRVDGIASDAEQVRRSVAATHRMCRECRTLVPRTDRTCPECGASMAGVPAGGASRIAKLLAPSFGSASSSLLGAIVAIHLALAFTAPGGFSLSIPRETLYHLGLKYTPLILAGEWWRLVNPIFLHGSLLHIGFNAIALANLGPAIESAVGSRRLLVLFVGAGVASFVASALLSPFAPSVGASGAVYGLIGFGIVHGRLRGGGMARAFSDDLVRWAVFGLLMSLAPGIDWAAHGGGLVAGALAALFVGRRAQTSATIDRLWTFGAAIAVALPLLGFTIALVRWPSV